MDLDVVVDVAVDGSAVRTPGDLSYVESEEAYLDGIVHVNVRVQTDASVLQLNQRVSRHELLRITEYSGGV